MNQLLQICIEIENEFLDKYKQLNKEMLSKLVVEMETKNIPVRMLSNGQWKPSAEWMFAIALLEQSFELTEV